MPLFCIIYLWGKSTRNINDFVKVKYLKCTGCTSFNTRGILLRKTYKLVILSLIRKDTCYQLLEINFLVCMLDNLESVTDYIQLHQSRILVSFLYEYRLAHGYCSYYLHSMEQNKYNQSRQDFQL